MRLDNEEALPTTRRVELVGKKEFAAAALDPEHETFVVHVASLSSTPLDVHPSRRPQISGLIAKEAPTKVPDEYVDFADVFTPDLASELQLGSTTMLSSWSTVSNHPMDLSTA